MRTAILNRILMAGGVFLLIASSQMFLQAQTKTAGGGSFNLTKEVMEKKGAITWKAAPENAIPQDVCSMLAVCTGSTKLIALPRATEGGGVVGRGLFLTQDQKHADAVVLVHQTPSDTYYFLLGPDGNLAKAAYAQVTSKSWMMMGNALSQPTFEKDKAAWEKGLAKLGAPTAAAAPADKN